MDRTGNEDVLLRLVLDQGSSRCVTGMKNTQPPPELKVRDKTGTSTSYELTKSKIDTGLGIVQARRRSDIFS